MDFTPELTEFQGVILSADNTNAFSQLKSKGGNEDKIKFVVEKIKNYFHEKKLTSRKHDDEENNNKLRKFAFYLALNAELKSLEELMELEGIDIVIWTIPELSKCLLCELFWQLEFEEYLFEIIAYTNPQFALELIGFFIDSFKYLCPTESLKKLSVITSSCYLLICRLNFFKYNEKSLSLIITTAFSVFQKSLLYYTDHPNGYRLNNLKKDEQYKFIGNCLCTMLQVIDKCVNYFTEAQEFKSPYSIYELTYKEDSFFQNPDSIVPCNSSNLQILECLNNCNISLLDKCKDLVMNVSVDIFCAWSEFEQNYRSMQEIVGEICYTLREKLLCIKSLFEHPLISMLNQLSRKPVDANDVILKADIETIIKQLNSNVENKSLWINELIKREEVFDHEKCAEALLSNMSDISQESCYRLCTRFQNNYVKDVTNSCEILNTLYVECFHKCSSSDKQELTRLHFNEKIFSNKLQSVKFNTMLTETFNKLVESTESNATEIFDVFIQNPFEVLSKLFDLATENDHQTTIMLNIMELIREYSEHYYVSDTEPCVIKVVDLGLKHVATCESKKHNAIKFVDNLKKSNIVPETKLLLLVIMPALHKMLLDKQIESIDFYVKLLYEAFEIKQLACFRAPMLAMLAQVLDVVRWKITTFDGYSPSALQLTIKMQKLLFESYSDCIPEKEANWLRSKLKNVQPMNLYYYRRLWNPPGESFVEVVSGTRVHTGMDLEQLKLWLSQVLCSSSEGEWDGIWESLQVFGREKALSIIHKSLMLLFQLEKPHRTNLTWACLKHCYSNFVMLIKNKYLSVPVKDAEVKCVLQILLSTCSVIDKSDIEDFETVLLPLFSFIVERKTDFQKDTLKSFFERLQACDFSNVMKKMFSLTSL